MAQLWLRSDDHRWAVMPLDKDAFNLTADPPLPFSGEFNKDGNSSLVVLTRARGMNSTTWVLLAGPKSDVRLNGLALKTGLHVVANRDEIRIGEAGAIFFSTESLACVVTFPGSEQPLFCPRCKLEIVKQSTSVKCPQCGVWHHQTDDLPCWTYSGTCALCPQPTELDAGYQWTPEEI